MRYLSVVFIFFLVFFAGQLVPRPQNEWFYVTQSLWSLLIVFLILPIERSKTVLIICVLEIAHIFVNLMTCFYYMEGNYKTNLIYSNYPLILDILDGTELLILINGVPWLGLFNGIAQFFSHDTNRGAGNNRNIRSD